MGVGAQTEGVWQDGWRTAARSLGWPTARWPLGARLAALVFCLVAVGGGALTAALHVVAGDYLTRQAHQQLRSYAAELTSRPFTLFPGFRLAPGESGLGASDPVIGIAVLGAGGQQLISAGPATPPTARAGWLEVSEPVSYQAKHIPFVYGADDSSFSVTSKTGSGYGGTLVIGLDLATVGQTVHGLTVISLQVTGLAVLLAAATAAVATRMLLRPVASNAKTEAAAAEAAARDVAERTGAAIAETCRKIRRPLGVLAGLADYYRERDQLAAADLDRLMTRLADEAAQAQALVDELQTVFRDKQVPPAPGKYLT